MSVDIFWIPFDGPGRIGIATRPRGGDWLKDDIHYLHNAGTDLLVSMLTPDEVSELQLDMEKKLCQDEGMIYQSLPIPDRGIPSTRKYVAGITNQLANLFENGTNIVIHCRQGIGRSAMMVALILVTCGVEVDFSFQLIAEARGHHVPDTEEQHDWVEQYAAGLQMVNRFQVAEKEAPYKSVSDAPTE